MELAKALALVLDGPSSHGRGRLDLIGHILVTTQNALDDKNICLEKMSVNFSYAQIFRTQIMTVS